MSLFDCRLTPRRTELLICGYSNEYKTLYLPFDIVKILIAFFNHITYFKKLIKEIQFIKLTNVKSTCTKFSYLRTMFQTSHNIDYIKVIAFCVKDYAHSHCLIMIPFLNNHLYVKFIYLHI